MKKIKKNIASELIKQSQNTQLGAVNTMDKPLDNKKPADKTYLNIDVKTLNQIKSLPYVTEKKTEKLLIKMKYSTSEGLKALASKYGVSKNELINRLIDNAIKDEFNNE